MRLYLGIDRDIKGRSSYALLKENTMLRMKTFLAMLLVSSPVFALDCSIPLKAVDGSTAEDCGHMGDDGKCDKKVPLTLGRLAAIALAQPKKPPPPIAEQVIDGRLAQRLIDAQDCKLSTDEIVKIKNRIGELGFNSVVVANAVTLLDPDSVK